MGKLSDSNASYICHTHTQGHTYGKQTNMCHTDNLREGEGHTTWNKIHKFKASIVLLFHEQDKTAIENDLR